MSGVYEHRASVQEERRKLGKRSNTQLARDVSTLAESPRYFKPAQREALLQEVADRLRAAG